jgi:hypothetical protein
MITVRGPATITAASPSFADVSAAVSAAVSGDTVIVPAGSATWTSQLVITKGIILKGAGAQITVITSGYNEPNHGNDMDRANFLVVYAPESPALNEPFRLSGFTIDANNRCEILKIYNGTINKINKIRIDHNILKNSSNRVIMWHGTAYGVVDNNQIISNGLVMSSYGLNALAWSNLTFAFGTADNVYYEDNEYWINDYPHDAGLGGRYCVRYNTFHFSHPTAGLFPWFDAHGNMGTGGNYSVMGVEIYENIIDAGTKNVRIFDHRGGKMLAFNNKVNTTNWVSAITREEHNDSLNPPATAPDGQPQHVSDSYYWGNTKNGTTPIYTTITETLDYGGLTGVVPRANVHFWAEVPSFDGTSGMGYGLLANRPATCAAGVAYWATDTKTLYKAIANNTWSAYYTPYTYPHPLRKD